MPKSREACERISAGIRTRNLNQPSKRRTLGPNFNKIFFYATLMYRIYIAKIPSMRHSLTVVLDFTVISDRSERFLRMVPLRLEPLISLSPKDSAFPPYYVYIHFAGESLVHLG